MAVVLAWAAVISARLALAADNREPAKIDFIDQESHAVWHFLIPILISKN
jgi:hypothetical protein